MLQYVTTTIILQRYILEFAYIYNEQLVYLKMFTNETMAITNSEFNCLQTSVAMVVCISRDLYLCTHSAC